MNILMVSAENGALAGAKVGGLGDVVREAPLALARKGCSVSVVTPSYGFLHRRQGASPVRPLSFQAHGTGQNALLYEVQPQATAPGVRHYVIDHPIFAWRPDGSRADGIYCIDPPAAPFATDATRFAFFGAAVAAAVKEGAFGPLDVLHLHDWHTGMLMILRRYAATCQSLRGIRCVFSVHNLALQGVRPFEGSSSSLAAWYPRLAPPRDEIADPRWPNCVNPMAAGIRLADVVHTVSPAYAEEIIRPSEPPRFFGGEGLESDLQAARSRGRLIGILNGCSYPSDRRPAALSFGNLCGLLKETVLGWAGRAPRLASPHFVAHSRLADYGGRPGQAPMVLTAVTRAVEQKLYLMKAPVPGGRPALHALLETLGSSGLFILLGAGDAAYEQFLSATSARFRNFIFLNGYSDEAARALYASGDLFIMPSSYEPCGISQMLALRDGQPCVVHRVGGLKDTITDGVIGFSFEGATVEAQAANFVAACLRAVELRRTDPQKWQEIRRNAAAARFSWDDTAAAYLAQLYPP
ncbi:MAG: glycogen synthase [Hyphomicrobiales bacterium]